MGVSYDACDSCGDSRYEEFVAECSGCGHNIGTCCVVNNDINSKYAFDYGVKVDGTLKQQEEYGFNEDDYEVGDIIDDTGVAPKYCPFCNGNEVHDEDLLRYALKSMGITKDDLIAKYKESKEGV